MNKAIELRKQRAAILENAQRLVELAEKEDRDLTQEELETYDDFLAESESLETRAQRLESMAALTGGLGEQIAARQAASINKSGLGENEGRMFANFIRSGDVTGLKKAAEFRASNDTDMNITTAADGGYTVPTGHYNGIIAKRDEGMLLQRFGVAVIPGKGTTVNVPVDNEDDGEFVSTDEAAAYDRDAPAIDQKAMTLVKYTKKIELSVELLEDEDSRLLAFLENWVGRGMAKTHNSLLLTEVAANGTKLDDFSASAIAAGDPEAMAFNDNLDSYLEDGQGIGWVCRPTTFGAIAALTGSARLYAETPGGSAARREILGYPVAFSNKAAAIAASAKSLYFGNWQYVGYREAPGFSVLRDPYTLAHLGQIRLIYMFRAVYKVLQAEAIGYGQHASA